MTQMGASRQSGGAVHLTTAEVIERLSRFDGPPEQFLANLLAVQCQIGPAEGGAILRAGQQRGADVLAVFPPLPQGAAAPVWLAQGAEACRTVVAQSATVVQPVHSPDDMYGQPARRSLIMVPLRGERAVRGVAAFFAETQDPAVLAAIQERLELTVGLLSLYEMRLLLQRRQTDLGRLRAAMETLAAVNVQDRFAGMAMSLANEVAARWQCERVSIGFLKGRYVHVRAMSHTEKFTRKMKLVQDIEAAMEECLDQDVEILYPPPPQATYVGRAAGELAGHHGAAMVLSLPLRRAGDVTAVLTLERPGGEVFTVEEVESLRLAADLCTPRLANLEAHDRWFGARMAAAGRKGAAAVVGPKHTWIKLGVIAACAALAFAIFAKGDYRVEASFVLEPIELRVVPAPFDGFLQTVSTEPNAEVTGGKSVLATLETADLLLQLAAAKAERATYLMQAAAARRDYKTVEAQIAQAQAEKAAAGIDLYEYHISQAKIIAPISGVVTKGDLERQIGAPVKTGDVLFEVAPLDGLRAELSVPEEDVADLEVGQEGELATASFPDRHFGFVVERINPVAEVAEQMNIFKVRVRLKELDRRMRPGLEGVAKVDIDRRRYIWIWTRPIVRWVRMKLWI
jgi:multidrug resistance efflux pump